MVSGFPSVIIVSFIVRSKTSTPSAFVSSNIRSGDVFAVGESKTISSNCTISKQPVAISVRRAITV
jgi:hypothetical protein